MLNIEQERERGALAASVTLPIANWSEVLDEIESLRADNRDLVQHCASRLEASNMWRQRAEQAEAALRRITRMVDFEKMAEVARMALEPSPKSAPGGTGQ